MAPKGEPKRRVKLSNPRGDTGKISNNIYIYKVKNIISLPLIYVWISSSVSLEFGTKERYAFGCSQSILWGIEITHDSNIAGWAKKKSKASIYNKCLKTIVTIFLYWYCYKKKLHQKGTTSVDRGGPLYRENKRFQELGRSWRYLCRSRKTEGVCSWEDGQGKRVPVSISHRYKRIVNLWYLLLDGSPYTWI